MSRTIRIGTRKSLLARVQTQIVVEKIRELFPEITIEVVPISTRGDERLGQSLGSFGGKGVFTKELEEKLLSKEIDLAVHSAKDMPVVLPAGLVIGAVMGRTCTEDVFVTCGDVMKKYDSDISKLPAGFVVGTGSLRRELQILNINPALVIKSIRGNVQTRLNKLAGKEYDGIILAQAGLRRLFEYSAKNGSDDFDYSRFVYTPISTKKMLPAAAQGILAIESRESDLADILDKINCPDALEELSAERAFLQEIGGSCNAPAAALAVKRNETITMEAMYSADGKTMRRTSGSCFCREGALLGKRLAKELTCETAQSSKPGKVWLIGAGPGDMGLISLKGLECLKQADVVIYDHLAGSGLLNEVRDDALLLYAGKQAGKHYLKQEETNRLIVEYARQGKNVARLKGGDVFIFGRGGEEGLALNDAGIDFEIVPGISSSYAVPAYQGIPVTHRGLASSFHVITGHEDEKKTSSVLNYDNLAALEGTLVFLMGLKNLDMICKKLIAHGKDGNTPAAVLSSGTTAHQKMAFGSLKSIAVLAKEQGIQTPAITVIGDVTCLHEKLAWYHKNPMAGKSVLITATKPMADEMAMKLRRLGAEAIPFSLIRTKPVISDLIEQVYNELEKYTWVVFTSRNGVGVFFDGLKERKRDIRCLSHLKFAAIGDGTAKALESYGIYCDYVPEEYTSAAMATQWVPTLDHGDRVLLLRALQSSPVLPEALEKEKIEFTAAALYETVQDTRKAPELMRLLPQVDYIALCSASAAEAFCDMTGAGRMDHQEKEKYPKIVCIGPVTEKAARNLGLKTDLSASVYNIDGMIECINGDE